MFEIERPHVIQPENVIGVAMRDEQRIEPVQPCAQSLLAKVGGNVYLGKLACVFDQQPRAQAPITRIIRRAGCTFATDHRYADRSSSSEKGEFHSGEWLVASG